MPLQISTASGSIKYIFNIFGFTYLYIKSLICPSQTYFDYTLELCVNCTTPNCSNYFDVTNCDVCDKGYPWGLIC